MSETHLEKLVEERQFAGLLQTHSEIFFRLSNTLLGARKKDWNKKHYYQLINEAEALESFLDDYGARYNKSYSFLTELVASLRGFAQAGTTITHYLQRMDSYGALAGLTSEELHESRSAAERASKFMRSTIVVMLSESRGEAQRLGLEITPETFPEENFLPVLARRKLPRNVGQAEMADEEQRIAEVASRYLKACEMLRRVDIRSIGDPAARRRFLSKTCTEAQARVYESTVHNLQSTYDTHIQNTVLEARDDRLRRLRGHVSSSLHLLQAVTHLVHFIERHEDQIRSEEAKRRISELVDPAEVQDVCLNALLVWANRHLQNGLPNAQDLLPEYTNVRELELALPDGVDFHARPASLVVSVVKHHGTPVEMILDGQRCNASSILEVLVLAGSKQDLRRVTFQGDERPLADLERLFLAGLGELGGLEALPRELSYLRDR